MTQTLNKDDAHGKVKINFFRGTLLCTKGPSYNSSTFTAYWLVSIVRFFFYFLLPTIVLNQHIFIRENFLSRKPWNKTTLPHFYFVWNSKSLNFKNQVFRSFWMAANARTSKMYFSFRFTYHFEGQSTFYWS